jgi:mono/diheme cytochrome c family protein
MKRIALALSLIATALVAAACTETATQTNTSTPRTAASPAPSAAATPVDELAAARANYAQNCEACHGPTGVGGVVKVDEKQIKVASLKADHAIKHTDEQLAKTITNGEEAMPGFKDKMTPAEITDMVKFIRKEFQGK